MFLWFLDILVGIFFKLEYVSVSEYDLILLDYEYYNL